MIARDHESRTENHNTPTSKKNLTPPTTDLQERHTQLLQRRFELTETLAERGLQPWMVLERAQTYHELGYADLAAADAYLALTLAETGIDPDHSDLEPVTIVDDDEVVPWPREDDQDDALGLKVATMKLLTACLVELGCLQDAYDFCLRLNEGLEEDPETETEQRRLMELIRNQYLALHRHTDPCRQDDEHLDLASTKLPNSGFARREVYPWNNHEPDRSSPAALQELNDCLKAVAPDLEVRATRLPVLHNPAIPLPTHLPQTAQTAQTAVVEPITTTSTSTSSCLQLGLFATRPLPPNTPILRERSTITATRALHASLCDNCCSPLPSLSSAHGPPISCPSCTEAVFCSTACHTLAQSLYHPILCGNDDGVDGIGRDPFSKTPAEDLYFLLVTRALAMAAHQKIHPLDLPEIKYLWGDFNSVSPFSKGTPSASPPPPPPRTLPFTFQHAVVLPLRFLTTLSLTHPGLLSPNSPTSLFRAHDPWVLTTLYAKCRGVASARQSTWDGRPEVAAVHPMWCLANHSCSPNVAWLWGGGASPDGLADAAADADAADTPINSAEIVYTVRDRPVWTRPPPSTQPPPPPGPASETENLHNPHEQEKTPEAPNEPAPQPNPQPRQERNKWHGIPAGAEILNHYCDVRLPVGERRAWAAGALGGSCVCERCVWEEAEQERTMMMDAE